MDAEAMGDVGVGSGSGSASASAGGRGGVIFRTRRAMDGARVVEGEELGSNGGVYSRRIVWARQSANGVMVEIALPPTRESVEEARRAVWSAR